MPLGDSLTWGFDGGPSTTTYLDSLDDGGYRSPLYTSLESDGIDVTYVGVNTGNPSPTLTAAGQVDHNGFNGYRIDQIDGNLAASGFTDSIAPNLGGYWLTGGGGTGRSAETADIILLQIGANDIVQGYDPAYTGPAGLESDTQFAADETARLHTLINDIVTYEPNSLLLVDGTTPIFFTPNDNTLSLDYDNDVANLIATDYAGTNVRYVNMYQAINDGPIPNYQLYEGDGIHLNSYGYAEMGQAWETAILADYNFDAVPEPSTYALFIAGALALFAWRRLRKT